MKGFFYSNKLFLGELDYANEFQNNKTEICMGGICGDFSPNENYDSIRAEIQDVNSFLFDGYAQNSRLKNRAEIESYWEKWYSFNFNVQLENGYFLCPAGGYEIYDYREFPDVPLQVRTAGIHSHIFRDYFVRNKPFLNENWRAITIDEKFAIEEKYRTETKLVKKLSFYRDYLRDPKFGALAVNVKNGKVLYATENTGTDYFAIVDFNRRDEQKNPSFEFFNCFEDFLKKQ